MYTHQSHVNAHQDPLFEASQGSRGQADVAGLRCPQCLGRLTREVGGLVCGNCLRSWPILDGLPWLAADELHYHADVPEQAMRQLLEDTLQMNWRAAFQNLLAALPAPKRQVIAGNLLDPARAFGLSVLPLEQDSRVLDLGCGWGTLSVPLAESVGAVVAVDLAPLRARFTQLRAHEENLGNMTVLGAGDTQHLPFESDLFDVAILNGVLEWTAVSRRGNPRDIYRNYLDEVRRVLKPGGYVYIGIENRLSHWYWQGVAEDHVDLPYIALLPRWLADRYAIWRRGAPYRTHTYTLFGYKRLLRAGGFESLRFYYPHPTYRLPEKVIPLDDAQALLHALSMSQRRGAKQIVAHLVMRSGLFRLIPHSYLVVGRKPVR